MRHIKFIILENLLKDFERGKYSELHFLNLLLSTLYQKRDEH